MTPIREDKDLSGRIRPLNFYNFFYIFKDLNNELKQVILNKIIEQK